MIQARFFLMRTVRSILGRALIAVLVVGDVLALPSPTKAPDGSLAPSAQNEAGFDLPIQVRRIPKQGRRLARRGEVSGSIGLGNNADLLYSVPMRIGNIVTPLHLDTGSSDLWLISDQCRTNSCTDSTDPRYPRSSLRATGADVRMNYGDSSTGTFASGQVGLDTVTVAGIAMVDQPFGAINDTDNVVVQFGTSGIFGLGFPSGSKIQEALTLKKDGSLFPTDNLIASTYTDGPLLSRISMTGQLAMPMFTVSLQRSTIDIEGEGLLTVGRLPPGIDNSTLTWVPVRRYNSTVEGGRGSPRFAPNEVYASRWEIDIDAVYFNGQRLADSTIPALNGVDSRRTSALIDTGNSLLRGPEDVVNRILTTVSPNFDPISDTSIPSFSCSSPQTLSFEIGGKIFPVDPRDFIGEIETDDTASECAADNLVSTDAPNTGTLFRWSLGAPFLRSNLVAFHYGNLTHPSVDPPRIGIRSLVPDNADQLLLQAVANARNNNGEFAETLELPPTAQAATQVAQTVSSVAPSYTLTLSGTDLATARPTVGNNDQSTRPSSSASVLRPYLAHSFFIVTVSLMLCI